MNTIDKDQILKNRANFRKNIRNSMVSQVIKANPLMEANTRQQKQVDSSLMRESLESDKRDFFNVYELLEKIGEGANGVVKKCREKKTDKVYAVKITQSDQELIRMCKTNYQMLKQCNTPNIIKAKNLFIDQRKDTIFFVMEYCEHQSLAEFLESSSEITISKAKRIIKQLLETVSQLHAKGICHRDLKPQNILYNKQTEQIKIIDFGVSKRIYKRKEITKENMWTMTGTLYYKAPEMFEGGSYDELVDVWAVGVIAYRLIYGCLPFISEYQLETIEKISDSQPSYLEKQDISLITIDFLRAILRKNPKARLSASEALRHPWIEHNQEEISRLSRSSNILALAINKNRSEDITEFPKEKNKMTKTILHASQCYLIEEVDSPHQLVSPMYDQRVDWDTFDKTKDVMHISKVNKINEWSKLLKKASSEECQSEGEQEKIQEIDELIIKHRDQRKLTV